MVHDTTGVTEPPAPGRAEQSEINDEGADAAVALSSVAVAQHGRRRRNTRGGPRVLRVVIKLTAAERATVVAMAQAQGITPPALFMRAVLTGGTEAAAKFQRLRDELRAARRLLAAVSNNVNQLARQANAAAHDPGVPAVTAEQLASALAAAQRAAERIEAIAGAAGEGQGGSSGSDGAQPTRKRRTDGDLR